MNYNEVRNISNILSIHLKYLFLHSYEVMVLIYYYFL